MPKHKTKASGKKNSSAAASKRQQQQQRDDGAEEEDQRDSAPSSRRKKPGQQQRHFMEDYHKKKNKGKKNGKNEEEAAFRAQLALCGLRIEVVAGDGNCLFRSLSDQLRGDELSFAELRTKVVAFEAEREADFAPFVEDDEAWEDYLRRMREDGEWGGNLELYAICQKFRAHVVVHRLAAPRFELVCAGATKSLHFSFHGESHYNSVRRADDDSLGTPPLPLPDVRGGDDDDESLGEQTRRRLQRACPWAPRDALRDAARNCPTLDDAVEFLVDQRRTGALLLLPRDDDDDDDEQDDDNPGFEKKKKTRPLEQKKEKSGPPPQGGKKHTKAPARSAPCPCGSGKPYKKCCRKATKHQQQKNGRRRATSPTPPDDDDDQRGASSSSGLLEEGDLGALRI